MRRDRRGHEQPGILRQQDAGARPRECWTPTRAVRRQLRQHELHRRRRGRRLQDVGARARPAGSGSGSCPAASARRCATWRRACPTRWPSRPPATCWPSAARPSTSGTSPASASCPANNTRPAGPATAASPRGLTLVEGEGGPTAVGRRAGPARSAPWARPRLARHGLRPARRPPGRRALPRHDRDPRGRRRPRHRPPLATTTGSTAIAFAAKADLTAVTNGGKVVLWDRRQSAELGRMPAPVPRRGPVARRRAAGLRGVPRLPGGGRAPRRRLGLAGRQAARGAGGVGAAGGPLRRRRDAVDRQRPRAGRPLRPRRPASSSGCCAGRTGPSRPWRCRRAAGSSPRGVTTAWSGCG